MAAATLATPQFWTLRRPCDLNESAKDCKNLHVTAKDSASFIGFYDYARYYLKDTKQVFQNRKTVTTTTKERCLKKGYSCALLSQPQKPVLERSIFAAKQKVKYVLEIIF